MRFDNFGRRPCCVLTGQLRPQAMSHKRSQKNITFHHPGPGLRSPTNMQPKQMEVAVPSERPRPPGAAPGLYVRSHFGPSATRGPSCGLAQEARRRHCIAVVPGDAGTIGIAIMKKQSLGEGAPLSPHGDPKICQHFPKMIQFLAGIFNS